MSITSDLIRCNTDTINLACLCGFDSYGYEIGKAIRQRTGNRYELKESTLYCAFRRLEEAGLITSYWGDEPKGARRRYYRVTAAGLNALEQNRADWQEAKSLIDSLI